MLNTKILSILAALVMFAGVGALAADSAAPISGNCHQKECKTSWMPVNKDPKCMDKHNYMPVNKDPKAVWKAPCKTVVKDPVVGKFHVKK